MPYIDMYACVCLCDTFVETKQVWGVGGDWGGEIAGWGLPLLFPRKETLSHLQVKKRAT